MAPEISSYVLSPHDSPKSSLTSAYHAAMHAVQSAQQRARRMAEGAAHGTRTQWDNILKALAHAEGQLEAWGVVPRVSHLHPTPSPHTDATAADKAAGPQANVEALRMVVVHVQDALAPAAGAQPPHVCGACGALLRTPQPTATAAAVQRAPGAQQADAGATGAPGGVPRQAAVPCDPVVEVLTCLERLVSAIAAEASGGQEATGHLELPQQVAAATLLAALPACPLLYVSCTCGWHSGHRPPSMLWRMLSCTLTNMCTHPTTCLALHSRCTSPSQTLS